MSDRRRFIAGLAGTLLAGALPRPGRAQDVRRGRFKGASGHVTAGTAGIVVQDGKAYVSLAGDFRFDGAPDPKVALGRGGYDPRTLMGALKSDSGAQSYAVPAGIDTAQYDEVWIWCERFNVPLGVARIAP